MNALRKRIHPPVILIMALFLTVLISGIGFAGKAVEKVGYLGVTVDDLDQLEKEELGLVWGILVTEVHEDSPAEKAGILEEDVIQRFNGKKVRRPDDLVRLVRKTEPESKAEVAVIRDGKEQEIQVIVGAKEKEKWTWKGGDDLHKMVIKKHESRGYMGVKLQTLNPDLASYFNVDEEGGALILEIMEDSPAEKAGLKPGDVIVQLDDSAVQGPEDVVAILKDFNEEDEVSCTVLRKGNKKSVRLTLEEHPAGYRYFFQTGEAPGPGHTKIVVPEIDMDEFHKQMKEFNIQMDELKDDMKDMDKEIKIKVKQFDEQQTL